MLRHVSQNAESLIAQIDQGLPVPAAFQIEAIDEANVTIQEVRGCQD